MIRLYFIGPIFSFSHQNLIKKPFVFQCVICCAARAVMQVAPCNHQALCRLCFVHTIQEAVAARDLPLKCLVCGSKIIRVKNNSKSGQEMMVHPVHVGLGSRVKKIPKSVSGYSLCASSEMEEQLRNQRHPSLAQSQSSYSMSSGNFEKRFFFFHEK